MILRKKKIFVSQNLSSSVNISYILWIHKRTECCYTARWANPICRFVNVTLLHSPILYLYLYLRTLFFRYVCLYSTDYVMRCVQLYVHCTPRDVTFRVLPDAFYTAILWDTYCGFIDFFFFFHFYFARRKKNGK